MTVDDQSMQTLWKLTNDLTTQLVFNRNATLELKQQLADLKARVASGSLVLSDDIPIPLQASNQQVEETLRISNERLAEENSQLQDQLREYERWIEYIMTKFRLQNFAMVHSRKEVMQEAYKIIEQERELNNQLRQENAELQQRLVQVGSIARRAINDEYYKTETLVDMLLVENQGLREMLGVAEANGSVDLYTNNIMDGLREPGYRVSFPSTGSYNGSSEGDEMDVIGGLGAGGGALNGHVGNGGSRTEEPHSMADEQPTDEESSSTLTTSATRILNDGTPLSEPPTPLDTIPRSSLEDDDNDERGEAKDEHDCSPDGEDLHSSPATRIGNKEGHQGVGLSDTICPQEERPPGDGNNNNKAVEPSAPEHVDNSNGQQELEQHSTKATVAQRKSSLPPMSPPPPLLSSPSVSAAPPSISINTDVSGVVTAPKRTNKPRKKRK